MASGARIHRQRATRQQEGHNAEDADCGASQLPVARQAPAAIRPMRRHARAAQQPARQPELQQAERHADGRREEPHSPPVPEREPARDQRPDECAQVDPHVENREARVAAATALGVEVGHQRGDARLQQPDAQHDHGEAREEQLRRPGNRQHQVADGHQCSAGHHGPLRADQPVGYPAARQRRHEDSRGVEPVDRGGRPVVEAVAAGRDRIHEEQHEQRTHPVEREALPHLREEERCEATRVPEEPVARITHPAAPPRAAPCRRSAAGRGTARTRCRARRAGTSGSP